MAEKEEKEKVIEVEEREFTIPLRRKSLRKRRAFDAIQTIRKYIARHMHAEHDKVWIDMHVNEAIWKCGSHIFPKLRVKAIKFKDELVEVSMLESKEPKTEMKE